MFVISRAYTSGDPCFWYAGDRTWTQLAFAKSYVSPAEALDSVVKDFGGTEDLPEPSLQCVRADQAHVAGKSGDPGGHWEWRLDGRRRRW